MKAMSVKPLAAACVLAVITPAQALDLGTPVGADVTRWGAGLHYGFAAGGLSAKYRYTDKVTLQGTAGLFGDLQSFGIRGLYTFNEQPDYDVFAFGSVGLWRWDGSSLFESESSIGLGAGVGVEYTFPDTPFAITGEIGFGLVSFDNYDYTPFGIGLGAHYYLK